MPRVNTTKSQILKVLESGSQGSFTLSSGEILRCAGHESVTSLLEEAHARMDSSAEKRSFCSALGELVVEYLEVPWSITADSAVVLLCAISGIHDYRQLKKIIPAFNRAKLSADESDRILYVLLSLLMLAPCTVATRWALSQLVDGPKFCNGYAIEAFQLALDYHQGELHEVFRKYAPKIHALFREVEQQKDADEKKALQEALETLQARVSRGAHKAPCA